MENYLCVCLCVCICKCFSNFFKNWVILYNTNNKKKYHAHKIMHNRIKKTTLCTTWKLYHTKVFLFTHHLHISYYFYYIERKSTSSCSSKFIFFVVVVVVFVVAVIVSVCACMHIMKCWWVFYFLFEFFIYDFWI